MFTSISIDNLPPTTMTILPKDDSLFAVREDGRTTRTPIQTDELVTLFNRILYDLEVFIPYTAADVFLERAERLHLIATRHFSVSQVGTSYRVEDVSLYQKIAQTQRPLVIGDTQRNEQFQSLGGGSRLRSWMGIPLIVNGKVQGLISIASNKVAFFGDRETYLAQTFINQAAVALEKAEIAQALALEKRTLELMYQISQSLTQSLDLSEVAKKALEQVTALYDCDGGIYILENSSAKQLKTLAISGYTDEMMAEAQQRPYLTLGKGLLGHVAALGEPTIISDVLQDERWIATLTPHSVRSKIYIPLKVRNELIGVLTLSHPAIDFFKPSDLANLTSLSAPIALALQNARLFTAERLRRQEAETLRNATSTLILNLNQEQVLQELLERLRQVVPLDSACFMLLKRNQLHAVAGIGLPKPEEIIGHYFPTDNVLFIRLQEERKAIYLDDVRKIDGFQAWGNTDYIRGWMGVPLLHRGILIGYLTLDSRKVGTYGETEAMLAQAFANQATITLVNAQLLQDVQRSVVEQRMVSRMLRQLNATTSTSEIIPDIAADLFTLSKCDAIELACFDLQEKSVSAELYQVTADGIQRSVHHRYAFDESAAVPTLLHGRIHQTPQIQTEQDFPVEDSYLAEGYTARLGSPLQVNQRTLGAIHLLWRSPHDYQNCNIATFSQVADAIAMAMEKATLFTQTKRRAEEMEKLANLSMALRQLETRREIIETGLQYALDTFRATRGDISFPAEDGDFLEIESSLGITISGAARRLPIYNSVIGHVYRTGQPMVATNIFTESMASSESIAAWRAAGYESATAIFAPLHTGNEIIGVLGMVAGNPSRPYTENDLHLLAAMAGILGTALHRSAVLETMEKRVLMRTRDLAEANSRLQELDRMKSEFVANVSHELRTPLTNMRFYLDLLNRGRPERRQNYIQILEEETKRLYILIESILDLSRLSATRAQGTFQVVDFELAQVAQEIYQSHLMRAKEKGITLNYIDGNEAVYISADRNQIIQVINNLLANSINYTTAGGTIELSLAAHEECIEIAVHDTGIGIEPDEQEHLFERFYRGGRVTELGIPGTGLGLSIVKEIVDLHRGQIHVESTPGVGSTFMVWLPKEQSSTD